MRSALLPHLLLVLCTLFTSLMTSSAFFVSHLSHGKMSTTKDTTVVIEFVHVEKQYKTEKYLMPGILYTCQIA